MVSMETITINRHYAFTSRLHPDAITDTEESFSVKVKVTPEGHYDVTGDQGDLEALAMEITLDDYDSVDEIMDTMRYAGEMPV